MKVIQTKKDLMQIKGSSQYISFLKLLKGSMTKKVCITERPEDYDEQLKPGEEGYIELEFEEVENLDVITRFGLTKQELLDLCKEAGI